MAGRQAGSLELRPCSRDTGGQVTHPDTPEAVRPRDTVGLNQPQVRVFASSLLQPKAREPFVNKIPQTGLNSPL